MRTLKNVDDTTLDLRFVKLVDMSDTDGCWPWLGSADSKGYGEIQAYKDDSDKWIRKRATHVSWWYYTGEWPTQWMLHKCHNPPCVNPNHLYEGTILENNRDIHQRTRDLIKENADLRLQIAELKLLLKWD